MCSLFFPDCLRPLPFFVLCIGQKRYLWSSRLIPVLFIYLSSMATGHVRFPVLAMTSSSPGLHWSVLLCKIMIFIIFCDFSRSQGLRQISLNCKTPENASRHAIASHRSVREPDLSASLTIASNMFTVTGSFLIVGFASDHCRPSSVGELKPAVVCSQDTLLHASSTNALELVSSLRCCRYREKRLGFAGTASRSLEPTQVFHLWKARKYFVTMLFALLLIKVAGNLLAKIYSSGSSSSSSSLQLPWALTSVDKT